MSTRPTLDDFAARIDWHLKKAHEACRRSIRAVEFKASAEGLLRSGPRIVKTFDAAHIELDGAVAAALGELKRIARLDVLDAQEMRGVTIERLQEFTLQLKALTKPDQLKEFGPVRKIDEMLAEFDTRLAFAVRQFDVGLEDLAEPEEPQVTNNSIHVGSMVGSVIQQSGSGSVQRGAAELDIGAALRAIDDLSSEILGAKASDEIRELRADLATIKAQLDKTTPNRAVLVEAAKSIRSIAEGVVAGAITNRAVQAAADLLRAIGLG